MKQEPMDQPVTQILEYWQAVRQHKWWIFFLTLGLTLVSFVVIALLPDQYEATTTILVDPQQVSDQYVNPPVKQSLTDRLQTISQEVLSTTRLQEIIDRYHLYPELQKSMSREQVIDYMRTAITIEVKHASGNGPGAFTITYTGTNPVTVAQVTNELATRFITWNLQTTEQAAEVTTEFLGDQLQDAKSNLVKQEGTVRDFKMKHLGEMPDNLAANLGTLAQLRVALQANSDTLNRLEQERIELTRLPATDLRRDQPQAMSQRDRLTLEKMKLEDELMDLRRRYTPTHPEVTDAIARLQRVSEELKALPADTKSRPTETSPTAVRLEIIAREMTRLTEQQQAMSAQIAAYQTKVDAIPMREQQLTDLTRDYEISKEQYRTLLSKKYSADMASDLERKQKGERFTVLDAASAPGKPVRPKRRLLLMASTLGSLLLSIFLVLGKEKLDMTIKAEKQMEELLPASVTLLAAVPTIDTPTDKRRRLRFALFALTTSLLAFALVAGILWRIHPSL